MSKFIVHTDVGLDGPRTDIYPITSIKALRQSNDGLVDIVTLDGRVVSTNVSFESALNQVTHDSINLIEGN